MKKSLKLIALMMALLMMLVGCGGGGQGGGDNPSGGDTPASLDYEKGTELRVAAGYNSDKTGISYTNADVTGSGILLLTVRLTRQATSSLHGSTYLKS